MAIVGEIIGTQFSAKVEKNDAAGYYYQEDGVFLGKIGNSEDVYITDKGTFEKIKNKEKVDSSKVIAFTQKYKFNNKQLLDRAHWCYGEGGGLYSDYYAFAIINLKEHGVWGPAKKPFATDEAMYKTKMTHKVTQIKEDGKKIKVIKNMYPGYFTGTDGNVNSKAFAEKRKNVKDLNSLIRANQTIKSVIASIMGTIADPTNGAYQWVGGEGSGGGIYKYPDKNNATDVVNVTAQGRYHVTNKKQNK